jgi:hypothetical protein
MIEPNISFIENLSMISVYMDERGCSCIIYRVRGYYELHICKDYNVNGIDEL